MTRVPSSTQVSDTPARGFLPLLLLGCAMATFVALYFKLSVDLAGVWISDDNASHSLLLVPIIGWLVWARRSQLAATPRQPSGIGLALVVASLLVLLVGTAGVEFFLMRVSAIGAGVGVVLYLAGWGWLRILAFPVALGFLVIPIPPVIFYQLTFPLQVIATKFGVVALQLVHIPVLREGNVIWLAQTTLEVTEACSGIRSLLSLFSLAVIYGYFSDARTGPRVVIALSSIPIAILANGFRIAGTGMAAEYIGSSAAQGFFHSFSGWTMFLTSAAMLVGVAALLKAFPGKSGTKLLEPVSL